MQDMQICGCPYLHTLYWQGLLFRTNGIDLQPGAGSFSASTSNNPLHNHLLTRHKDVYLQKCCKMQWKVPALESETGAAPALWMWNTMSSFFPEGIYRASSKLHCCWWSGWWSMLWMFGVSLTFFVVYLGHWMPRISTAPLAFMWGPRGQRHSPPNEDARMYYQGMGSVLQGPKTNLSSKLLQLTASFPCTNQSL